jgi:putative transcriptional regulator
MAKTKGQVDNKVRQLRFMADEMTQGQLAKEIGVSRQTIIAIEQGKFCPSLESALKMSELFGLTVNEIFTLAKVAKTE